MATPFIRQSWDPPTSPRPIVIIGCGGIVNDAHLPAYRKANLPVAGVYDVDPNCASATAAKWGLRSFTTIAEAISQLDVIDNSGQSEKRDRSEKRGQPPFSAGRKRWLTPFPVFDVAVPPEFEFDVVSALPDGSTVLLQKPMGVDLADARRIREVCRKKKLIAAVNFQMRFAPMMLAAKSLIDSGALGELVDLSFHFNLRTPWELFPFLKKLKRCEILVHTVHHLDVCRFVLGEPHGVYARTIQHPSFPDLASTKTSIILNYGSKTRCALSINHNYEFGPEDECADLRIQGTNGALRVSLGLLLNYPTGKPETLDYRIRDGAWINVPINGRWFPDGFVGVMSNLQRFAAGEDDKLITNVEDAYRTMALVEACYLSDATGGTPIPE